HRPGLRGRPRAHRYLDERRPGGADQRPGRRSVGDAERAALRHRAVPGHGRGRGARAVTHRGTDTAREEPPARLGEVLLAAVGASGIELPGQDTGVPAGTGRPGRAPAVAPQRLGLREPAKGWWFPVDVLACHNPPTRAELPPSLVAPEPQQARCTFPPTTATTLAYLGTGR